MTCGDKFNKNCPTGGSRVDPEEVDGRATCDRPGCGKKLRGDGRCVDGHVQGEPPVMADLDGLLDLLDALRTDGDNSLETDAQVVYARYAVAVAREGPDVVRTGWVYRNRGAEGKYLEDQCMVWADTQEDAVAQANELGCDGDHWELTPLAEYMQRHHDPSFGPLTGTPQELGAAGVRALLAVIAEAHDDDLWHNPRAVAARDRIEAAPAAVAAAEPPLTPEKCAQRDVQLVLADPWFKNNMGQEPDEVAVYSDDQGEVRATFLYKRRGGKEPRCETLYVVPATGEVETEDEDTFDSWRNAQAYLREKLTGQRRHCPLCGEFLPARGGHVCAAKAPEPVAASGSPAPLTSDIPAPLSETTAAWLESSVLVPFGESSLYDAYDLDDTQWNQAMGDLAAVQQGQHPATLAASMRYLREEVLLPFQESDLFDEYDIAVSVWDEALRQVTRAAIDHRDWNPTGDTMEQMLAEGGGELPHERAGYPIIYITSGGNQLCSLCAMEDLLKPIDEETYGVQGYRLLDEPEVVTYCDECQSEFSYSGGEEGEEVAPESEALGTTAAPRLCIHDGCEEAVNPVTARCGRGHVQFYADAEWWEGAPTAGGGIETTVDFMRFELHSAGVDDDQQRHNSRQAISSYLRQCLKEMAEGDALALSRAKELVDLMRQRIPAFEQNVPRHLRRLMAQVDERVAQVMPATRVTLDLTDEPLRAELAHLVDGQFKVMFGRDSTAVGELGSADMDGIGLAVGEEVLRRLGTADLSPVVAARVRAWLREEGEEAGTDEMMTMEAAAQGEPKLPPGELSERLWGENLTVALGDAVLRWRRGVDSPELDGLLRFYRDNSGGDWHNLRYLVARSAYDAGAAMQQVLAVLDEMAEEPRRQARRAGEQGFREWLAEQPIVSAARAIAQQPRPEVEVQLHELTPQQQETLWTVFLGVRQDAHGAFYALDGNSLVPRRNLENLIRKGLVESSLKSGFGGELSNEPILTEAGLRLAHELEDSGAGWELGRRERR